LTETFGNGTHMNKGASEPRCSW